MSDREVVLNQLHAVAPHTAEFLSRTLGETPGARVRLAELARLVGVQVPGPFEATGARLGRVTDEKHVAYGRALERVPVMLSVLLADMPAERLRSVEGLQLVQGVSRILEKFCRLAGPDPLAYGENPWVDIAGYAVGYATLSEQGAQLECTGATGSEG